ncbi:MAG: ubiquinone/menaquinone biosynthesis C-methyltransferase UbiE [Nitrospinaceae bacterium]|nr:MAG: ubiquinone/menaquinone biosynthesis C-methyltransferase UbiE [Nitrospinaceae bacterium]
MQTLEKTPDFSRQIQSMFGAVAPRYDFINRLLSAGRDQYWRKVAVDLLSPNQGEQFLDIATGTSDIALEIASRHPSRIKVMGMDFSGPMLNLGKGKIAARGFTNSICLQKGCGEDLPFADASFHGAITAFGIRNFSDPERSLGEMHRVLKKNGRMVILEFSHPTNAVLGSLYRFYFHRLLPQVGKTISRHNSAYQYLPQSVSHFPMRGEFACLMEKAGFRGVSYRDLTFGIVTLYRGEKNA